MREQERQMRSMIWPAVLIHLRGRVVAFHAVRRRQVEPTTSRILSISSGSGEILKLSVRQCYSPNARQIRCTLVGEIPAPRASSRLDQCVAPSGGLLQRPAPTSSTWASVTVRGIPGRGSSPGPSRRLARKRARHVLSVPRLTPSRATTGHRGPGKSCVRLRSS
jgi:hypothetical protein